MSGPSRRRSRTGRRIGLAELAAWGAAPINTSSILNPHRPARVGLLRLGVPTDAARGRRRGSGRRLSAAIHDGTDADGLLNHSRLTGAVCRAICERAVEPRLKAGDVADLPTLAALGPALATLGVEIVPTA